MPDYRIIDADGHVMELDEQLRDYIGSPYRDLEWHRSYSFWPGLNMDGYLRALRKSGGWAGGGSGPKPALAWAHNDWLHDRFMSVREPPVVVALLPVREISEERLTVKNLGKFRTVPIR